MTFTKHICWALLVLQNLKEGSCLSFETVMRASLPSDESQAGVEDEVGNPSPWAAAGSKAGEATWPFTQDVPLHPPGPGMLTYPCMQSPFPGTWVLCTAQDTRYGEPGALCPGKAAHPHSGRGCLGSG